MIVRIHFVVLLCFLAGYFTTINGIYLNFASPKNKASYTYDNEPKVFHPRDLEKWYRRGRNNYRKLVILDRKNKQVDAFVRKVMNIIENNEVGELINPLGKRKIICHHMAFGSMHNPKAKRKHCKHEPEKTKRKQPWLNFVIPVKKNVFIDPTRQGFSEDYLIDFNRRADVDFDYYYYNGVNRAQHDAKHKKDKKAAKAKKNKETQIVDNSRRLTQRMVVESPKLRSSKYTGGNLKRFAVVKNRDQSLKSGDKPSRTKNSDDDSDTETENEMRNDSGSSYESEKPKTEKLREQWNGKKTYEADDSSENSEEDSDLESKEKPKHNLNSAKNYADIEDVGLGTHERFKPNHQMKFKKEGRDNEKYVYVQGHRVVNPVAAVSTQSNEESMRRMRNRNYFLPKRSIWNENQINHLGFYWNSHEKFD